MIILELFSGTGSFSKVCKERGHKCFTLDFNKKFNPDLCINILDFNILMLPKEFRNPDVVWASPPCTEYSHAKRTGIRNINEANKVVEFTKEIIKDLHPKYWIIENPQTGLLKKQQFMFGLEFCDASYCKYGFNYRKQTRFWNNIGLKLKVCNKDCKFMNGKKHIGSAGNGRKKYTDKNYKKEEKYQVPKELCLDIIKQIEVPKKAEENKKEMGE
ncbi:MAG: DNA cytosine methyltransferase [Candidatus Pacearchaeota archaeon]|jgi:site-specific DNA-cytosine methylase